MAANRNIRNILAKLAWYYDLLRLAIFLREYRSRHFKVKFWLNNSRSWIDGVFAQWASCQIRKIAGYACAGNVGNVFPARRISDPDMHHGTCVMHVSWCMSGSLTSNFLWSRWRGKCSRHSRRMRNRNFTYLVRGPYEKISATGAFCRRFSSHTQIVFKQNFNWKMLIDMLFYSDKEIISFYANIFTNSRLFIERIRMGRSERK